MKVVILAAGRGARMGFLTKNTPKSLLEVGGIPIIVRTLNSLPACIKEIHIVVKYQAEKIIDRIGYTHLDRQIHYHNQDSGNGTAISLDSAKNHLKNEKKFLVLCGDDIYHTNDLSELASNSLAYGIAKRGRKNIGEKTLSHKNGYLDSVRIPSEEVNIWVGVGAFILNENYFNYHHVMNVNNEYSLPHTVTQMKNVKVVEFKNWIQINTPAELLIANDLHNTP